MKDLLKQIRDEYVTPTVLLKRTKLTEYSGLCGAAQQLYLNDEINSGMYEAFKLKIENHAKKRYVFWTFDLEKTDSRTQFIWKPFVKKYRLAWINKEIAKL